MSKDSHSAEYKDDYLVEKRRLIIPSADLKELPRKSVNVNKKIKMLITLATRQHLKPLSLMASKK